MQIMYFFALIMIPMSDFSTMSSFFSIIKKLPWQLYLPPLCTYKNLNFCHYIYPWSLYLPLDNYIYHPGHYIYPLTINATPGHIPIPWPLYLPSGHYTYPHGHYTYPLAIIPTPLAMIPTPMTIIPTSPVDL